ncbi:MAG: metallophosphoesterase [Planctomycetota bacterium]
MQTRTTSLFLFVVLGLLADSAIGQAIAPVTHDRHTHSHNQAHPREEAGDRFHTSRDGAPLSLPAEDEAFTFVIFGDRTGGPNEGIDILAQAVADTNLLEPDLVMTVGDLIDGYNQTPDWLKQAEQYKAVMGELLCPWFPVAGNHDVYWRGPNRPEGEHEENYEMHFGPLWYAFEHKDCFFIVLYSDEGDEQDRRGFRQPSMQRMSDEQFSWLEETLGKAEEAKHVFVFLHHPRWLGRGYGEHWQKVHALLVEAGNVSGVFAGHIHHMRYDPKDNIEYFALATAGGYQPGWAPRAGWLHHFTTVTVREGQIAVASIPVGGVIDSRGITGEVSEQSEVLGRARTMMSFEQPMQIEEDGSVLQDLTVTITNPASMPIEIEVIPTSEDSRWNALPDHRHATIKPGGQATMTFRIVRAAGLFDTTARPVVMRLGIDLLTDRMRYAIPVKQMAVPGSLILSE